MLRPMEQMCADCPFGNSSKQRHMRRSLRPGRFEGICQDVFRGAFFACHKTTTHDDDGETVWTPKQRECAGAIAFRQRAIANRERAEKRARL